MDKIPISLELTPGNYLLTVLPDGGRRAWNITYGPPHAMEIDDAFEYLNKEAEEEKRRFMEDNP